MTGGLMGGYPLGHFIDIPGSAPRGEPTMSTNPLHEPCTRCVMAGITEPPIEGEHDDLCEADYIGEAGGFTSCGCSYRASRGLLAAHDAQVLRDAADEYGEVATEPGTEQVPEGWRFLTVAEWLRMRADRIAGGTSA